ncbi:hypothetical protein [Wolbachia endosymbiont of Folsomia candida]|uniref:hypothetical protein n=1 Tax=Wolbachia endosymbiont of Folsomia candida TaxID=169402 RepID=UPI001F403273|nr:hypothetical protein [Wolbachia endosymbiont of Folsomia candida]
MKQIIIRILKSIRGKKSNDFSKSSSNSYSKSNNYSSYNHDEDAKQKVKMIKQLLIQDIEQAIDKRLHSIFFGEKNRSH